MTLRIASSPYTHKHTSTSTIMVLVALSALPGLAAQQYYFGWGNLIQIIIAGLVAISSEAVMLCLRQLPLAETLKDNSALLTGLLLGVSIPPLAPWWLIVIGTLFAIIISKHLYGGLGQNLFNPAMVGYVVLLISFPVQMTSWLPPESLQSITLSFFDTMSMIFRAHTMDGYSMQHLQLGYDGVSQATPIDTFKTGLRTGQSAENLRALPICNGVIAGLGWQWVNIGFLLGGIFLLWIGYIRWHIPLSFLTTLALCATLSWLISPDTFISPLVHLFSGATMIGAFFIATDPVTASTTNTGRLLYGVLIGLLVWLIRSFGGYPDGVAFAVLLTNICVPLIDHYTQPRVYGHPKRK